MRGRQKGRPTKWVIDQGLDINRTGVSFIVWKKWKRNRKMVGTLIVSVGGVRWLPARGEAYRQKSWGKVADWLST